ncbi:hypothetical protein [Corallococcus aberystwythensis]|uniref:Pilus assembly protein n=1 Tax=Corallococcus aberystwythensis TaxID=2316722 RepID=A0A3A8R006_9BACT|nr:hypothetical protein [Corallococcus aberystwythensis]RKH74163.1 hypothetical protein D7W81_02400 [Corallococcus aberystwythensis]
MVTRARAGTRGQAMAELVLGLGVFVTVLIFGLHFAELTHLSLKAHEAVAAAAWDSTAHRVERPGVDGDSWYDASRIAAPQSTLDTNQRYGNWDGRQSRANGPAPTLVFTRANELITTCTRDTNPGNGFDIAATANAPAYGEPGSLSCVTQGSVSTINVPTQFLDDANNGLFTAPHLTRRAYALCGMGRPAGGAGCQGRLNLLLGDHGLTSDLGEAEECILLQDDVPGLRCANRAFHSLTHDTWDRSMGWTGAPERFAERVTGSSPDGRVTGFYLSFRGEESGTFGEAHERIWQTQPMDYNLAGGVRGTYRVAYNDATSLRASTSTNFVYLGRYTCD